MDWFEIFALITGVIYIVYEIRQKKFMWVVGIITSLACMWVFFRKGLYASFGLNTYYFITAFIGLWQWARYKRQVADDSSAENGDAIVLNRLKWPVVLVSFVACLVGILALSYGMDYLHEKGVLNENPMGVLDSAATMFSVVATWWLIKAYIQQWWLWIIADTLTVALCAMQGMWWMTALYLAYIAAAVYGLHYWKSRGRYIGEN